MPFENETGKFLTTFLGFLNTFFHVWVTKVSDVVKIAEGSAEIIEK